jgi:hypothetical protein
MLTAHRFTIVPTRDCRERLEQALSNERPIARGEKHRGAVSAIQAALADLNRGYLYSGEVDGYFGPRTYDAVEAFQRDYGLAADGVVGRQTMAQLDTLYSGDVVRKPRGLSVHVGVNYLDVGHYGKRYELASCVNDARKMREIAESLGYDAVTLEDEEAKVSNFTGFMRRAISDLYDGDSLLVTFSGHGSQVPNTSADAEADNLDETLCFYDRMLLDDEFYALLAQFREGVRVHAVFDSCHSGTVAKDPFQLETEHDAYRDKTVTSLRGEKPGDQPYSAEGLAKALEPTEAPERGAEPAKEPAEVEKEAADFAPPPKPAKNVDEDIAALFADLAVDTENAKEQPTEEQPTEEQPEEETKYPYRDLYDAIKNLVGPQEEQELLCSAITLSACEDSQTAQAGRIYSLFTYNIMNAWNSGSFEGSYSQFHSALVSVSPANSTPVINVYGRNWAHARLNDRPFAL